MKTSSKDISNRDLLQAFDGLKGLFQDMSETMQVFASDTEKRLGSLETKITFVEARRVTKDYLDDKLADLRGDLVVLARKNNRKLETVIEE